MDRWVGYVSTLDFLNSLPWSYSKPEHPSVPYRVVVALIALLLIGGAAFLWFSPYLTGEDYLKDFFLHQLEQNLGRKIDVHRIKLVLFPRVRLELTQVTIHDRNPEKILLSAKKLDLVLRLIPLFRKQVVENGCLSKSRR